MTSQDTTGGGINSAAQHAFDEMKAIDRDKDGNPLTLEGVVRSMILKSPNHICWRDDALNVMYCTLGSGIGWNPEGRLGDRSPNNYINLPPEAGGQGVWTKDFGMDESLQQMAAPDDLVGRLRESRKRELDEAVSVVYDIDNRCVDYRPNRQNWYPISWYSCNLCVPENAQKDFFWGAVEVAKLIAQTDINYEHGHFFSQTHTKNTATEILEILKAREPG